MIAQKSIIRGYASPSPSASPSNVWTFNAFVTEPSQGQWYFLIRWEGAARSTRRCSPQLCMTEPFDNTYYPQGNYTPSDPAAQIVSIEISNNPVRPTPCP